MHDSTRIASRDTDQPTTYGASAPGDRAHHQKRFLPGHHRIWQRRVRRFMRQIFLAREESQECPALSALRGRGWSLAASDTSPQVRRAPTVA